MKRLHVSLAVTDIERSRAFYSALFGSEPTFERGRYAQWLLDDPRVNFVIEQSAGTAGLSHLGVQVAEEDELEAQFGRVAEAGGAVFDEGETTCCHARSTKNWTADPDGVRWETFLTHERTGEYGTPAAFVMDNANEDEDLRPAEKASGARCCG